MRVEITEREYNRLEKEIELKRLELKKVLKEDLEVRYRELKINKSYRINATFKKIELIEMILRAENEEDYQNVSGWKNMISDAYLQNERRDEWIAQEKGKRIRVEINGYQLIEYTHVDYVRVAIITPKVDRHTCEIRMSGGYRGGWDYTFEISTWSTSLSTAEEADQFAKDLKECMEAKQALEEYVNSRK